MKNLPNIYPFWGFSEKLLEWDSIPGRLLSIIPWFICSVLGVIDYALVGPLTYLVTIDEKFPKVPTWVMLPILVFSLMFVVGIGFTYGLPKFIYMKFINKDARGINNVYTEDSNNSDSDVDSVVEGFDDYTSMKEFHYSMVSGRIKKHKM
jgi:hypothetical protein